MKGFFIGVAVLAILLVTGAVIAWGMDAIHQPIAQQLQQAEQAALAEDWDTALREAAAARDAWDSGWRITAAFADHTPMDDIDGLFAELEIYAKAREKDHFAATCAHLAQLAEAMAKSHSPTWWNLL